MAKQRISYFPVEQMDAEMQREMDRCRREGTPRPESSAVRAHVPAAFWAFANSWRDLFRNGVCDHAIKELCRLYVSRSVQCDYCGNQRSIKAAAAGVIEDHVKDLLNFEKSANYSDKQKAALSYAEAITWHLETDDAFWAFANSWRDIFHTGVCDHAIKELARLYVSRAVTCEFCGNQRSIKAFNGRLEEAQTDDLVNFEKSSKYGEREKAALAYAEAITWRLDTDDRFWERLHAHFTEPELVELGCFIALTMGQQSWLRLLNIDHHQVMAGTAASMAPGFEDAEALAKSKAAPDYWAKQEKAPEKKTA